MDCVALGSTPVGGRQLSFLLLIILHIFVEIMIQFISYQLTSQEIEMFRGKETVPR